MSFQLFSLFFECDNSVQYAAQCFLMSHYHVYKAAVKLKRDQT